MPITIAIQDVWEWRADGECQDGRRIFESNIPSKLHDNKELFETAVCMSISCFPTLVPQLNRKKHRVCCTADAAVHPSWWELLEAVVMR